MIKHITFASLYVKDQEVMRRFLVDVLGFTTETDSEWRPGARWLEMGIPGARTRLAVHKAADFEREADTAYPVWFTADDLDATLKAVRAAGGTASDVVNDPHVSYITVTDPEGRAVNIGKSDD
ncbi:MAG: hypothetical protein JOZ47_07585 [Kutzneria sp.]|nr:hypothetical protein [Kutzneria sp.]